MNASYLCFAIVVVALARRNLKTQNDSFEATALYGCDAEVFELLGLHVLKDG